MFVYSACGGSFATDGGVPLRGTIKKYKFATDSSVPLRGTIKENKLPQMAQMITDFLLRYLFYYVRLIASLLFSWPRISFVPPAAKHFATDCGVPLRETIKENKFATDSGIPP